MPLNTTSPRMDVVFLKRRMRKGEVLAAPAPKKLSISLTGAAETNPVGPERLYLTGDIVLDEENPVIRLNARQSAIGSLTVENATEFGWDASNLKGVETLTTSDPRIPIYGNRKLVQFHKDLVVISGRHFEKLRRLAIRNNGGDLILKTNSNLNITVKNADNKSVLYLSRIKNELEIRYEKLENNNLASTFNF